MCLPRGVRASGSQLRGGVSFGPRTAGSPAPRSSSFSGKDTAALTAARGHVLPAPCGSSGLCENLRRRSRKDFSRWRCWGEKRGGAEGVPCRGMRGLPRVGALGAVWHSIQQVAPESIALLDPREPEWGSFLGDGKPF